MAKGRHRELTSAKQQENKQKNLSLSRSRPVRNRCCCDFVACFQNVQPGPELRICGVILPRCVCLRIAVSLAPSSQQHTNTTHSLRFPALNQIRIMCYAHNTKQQHF
uniref:(northern house mosquito) hypothetical protein n=1 Tax=Culex pipiens TaxID=7175 RepID=A0A8D8FT72_CULPI